MTESNVADRPMRWLYVAASLTEFGILVEPRLDSLSERHKVDVERPAMMPLGSILDEAIGRSVDGVVFELDRGWAGRVAIMESARLLSKGKGVLFYWPREDAVEVVDGERLLGHGAIWLGGVLHRRRHGAPSAASATNALQDPTDGHVAAMRSQAEELLRTADPTPVAEVLGGGRFTGPGAYLRTDYWAPIVTGGSYGHTCYVAAELAARSDGFVAFMTNRFALLDELGVRQVPLETGPRDASEESLLAATAGHLVQLRPALEVLRPAYLYERLVLGNLAGARVCRELGIPYIVEYNGSEVSMMRSFAAEGYAHAELFEQVEMAAFAQASVISVISDVVGESLIARGVDPAKIVVNPNGADAAAYAPATDEERAALRTELALGGGPVVGFIGTFGGWHGIEVLAESLPELCARFPAVRFLLIGEGNRRGLISDVVDAHRLEDRVLMTGRVEHAEGARLLKACDVFVSPHSSDMVDMPFFGSPTKLFEYMGLGRGIVASDLQQIGEILSPALRPDDFASGAPEVGDRRAVLCKPGVVSDFVAGVSALLEHPSVADAVGRNARRALEEHYTWARHVERLIDFGTTGAGRRPPEPGSRDALAIVETGDAYKDETQRQWNADACGSHYVGEAEEHSLEWFLEVERYRYDEYGPWMPSVMEFDSFAGKDVLEIGAGIGTDLAQFARHGARVTDYDLSAGHLALAEENFRLRGLEGTFVHGDAETLPFEDATFDLVYSNGVIHHTPNTGQVVDEILRVLRPGGRAIVMVYSEVSLHYWRNLVRDIGFRQRELEEHSIGEIMSRHVEISEEGARPLVKVYTPRRLKKLFHRFDDVSVVRRQMVPAELHGQIMSKIPVDLAGRMAGWNLVVKARKPATP